MSSSLRSTGRCSGAIPPRTQPMRLHLLRFCRLRWKRWATSTTSKRWPTICTTTRSRRSSAPSLGTRPDVHRGSSCSPNGRATASRSCVPRRSPQVTPSSTQSPSGGTSASTNNVGRVLRAKKLRLAAFSVGHVRSGYAPSLRPCQVCFSRRITSQTSLAEAQPPASRCSVRKSQNDPKCGRGSPSLHYRIRVFCGGRRRSRTPSVPTQPCQPRRVGTNLCSLWICRSCDCVRAPRRIVHRKRFLRDPYLSESLWADGGGAGSWCRSNDAVGRGRSVHFRPAGSLRPSRRRIPAGDRRRHQISPPRGATHVAPGGGGGCLCGLRRADCCITSCG